MNRPAALAVVAVAGVAALAVGVGGWTNGGNQHQRQSFDQVTEVRLATGGVDVEIVAGDRTATEVEQRVRTFWIFPAKPRELQVHRGILVLPEGCRGWNCSVDYTVRVPAGTKITGDAASGTVSVDGVASVDLRVASGDVDVTNVAGPVTVQAESGSVEAAQVRGDLTVRTRSGDIHVEDVNGRSELSTNSGTIDADDLRASVTAETSSGDIDLHLAAPASVRAEASSGDVDLRVSGGAYKVVTDSSSGQVEGGIHHDPSAVHTLEVRTSSGEITIERA